MSLSFSFIKYLQGGGEVTWPCTDMGVLTFFCLYSLKVERNTVNILVDVQFILKAFFFLMFNKTLSRLARQLKNKAPRLSGRLAVMAS